MGDLPSTGRMEGTMLVVTGIGDSCASFLAITPDGSLAVLQMPRDGDDGSETAFSAPRTIEVAVTYPDGAPAPGIHVSARHAKGWAAVGGAVLTGEEGVARVTGLLPGEANVAVAGAGRSLGTVDLSDGDKRVEATVARAREIIVRVTVAGQKGLPTTYRLSGTDPRQVDEDAEAGVLRFTWRPWEVNAEATIEITSDGYGPARATVSAEDPGPHEIALDLVPAGRLDVEVAMPEDGKARFVLQVWDDTKQAWTATDHDSAVWGGNQKLHLDPSGRGSLTELPSGRYRLVEAYARVASVPADVVAGGQPSSVRLDVSKSGWARGTVLGPDGEPVEGARVDVVGDTRRVVGMGPSSAIRGTQENGAFAVRVPGDRDVELAVSHFLYRPAAEGGCVVIRRPITGLVLRLAKGPTTVVRFDREVKGSEMYAYRGRVTVRLYRGVPTGDASHEVLVRPEDRVLRFGGYEPGTYTVWIDAAPYSPVVIGDAQLGAGETDLGEVAVRAGSTIQVRVLVAEGRSVPEMMVHAWSRAGPAYTRRARGKASELRVTGLGQGRFELDAHVVGGMAPPHREMIELDGTQEIEITLDLR